MNFPSPCHPLNFANEGVLVTAKGDNSTATPLHFYYTVDVVQDTSGDIDRYPKIVFKQDSILGLTFNAGNEFEVNGELVESSSFSLASIYTNQLLNTEVKFMFSQSYIVSKPDCDVWALDSVRIAVMNAACSRYVLQEDFDQSAMCVLTTINHVQISNYINVYVGFRLAGWDLYQATLAQGATNCINSNTSCLYFTGWEGERKLADRYATTPTLDLRILAAVYPPTSGQPVGMTCPGGEELV